MSTKIAMNNSIKLNTGDEQWVKTAGVKLAGEESKDRLYEPKHKKKLVRVLTVVAYVFFVSLAAIMLSLYYVFLWNGNQKDVSKSRQSYEAQHSNGLCSNGGNFFPQQSNFVYAYNCLYTSLNTTFNNLICCF